MSTPVEARSLDCRLFSLGLALSPGKTSILLGKEASPQALESGLGSELLSRLDATICHDGHIVLGTPIGTAEFMTIFTQRAVDEAIKIRMLISGLLMDRELTGADETGIFAPDEHDTILRYCVGAKIKHLRRTLPPGTAADEFHRLHSDLLDSHLNFSPPSVDHLTAQNFQLTSPHFDARGVVALPLGLEGHGFTPFSHPPLPTTVSNPSPTNPNLTDVVATHRHGAFYASWSASWSLIWAWVPLLRDEFLPSPSDPITPDPSPYKTQIRGRLARHQCELSET